MLKVYAHRKRNFKSCIFGGGFIGVNIGAKSTTKYGEETLEENVKEEIKRLDYGIVLGFNIEYGKMLFDFRYNIGLSEINEMNLMGTAIKNRGLNFMIGYNF